MAIKKTLITLMLSIFLLTLVSANNIPLFPNTGVANTNYDYVFNFTTSSDCTGVLLSYSTTVTTNDVGVGFVSIPLDSLTQKPEYLCEYKDGVLRKAHNDSDQIFNKVWANEVITGYIESANWSNVTINEDQISDLDHYSDSDISGSESAFDGWDKNESDDEQDTNETDWVNEATAINCSGGVSVGNYPNGTVICETDDTGAGADSNYSNFTNEWQTNIGNLNNTNSTQFENSGGTLNLLVSWFISQWNSVFSTKDTDDLTEGSTNLYDNKSWNESHADTKYIAQSDEGNLNVNNSQTTNNSNIQITESQVIDLAHTTDTNCSGDGDCSLITYDSETSAWDKNASDDFSGNYSDLDFNGTTGLSDGVFKLSRICIV